MKKVKVYKVVIATDERRSDTFGYCINQSLGLEASKGKGWWGAAGNIYEKDGIDAILDEETGEIYVKKGILLDKRIDLEEVKKERIEKLKKKIGNLSEQEMKLFKENINEFGKDL